MSAKKRTVTLENYLAGTPLNKDMERLMKGEEEEGAQPQTERRENFADGTPITDHDRRHLERMMGMAGWQVLLKLLDTGLQHQEDAARHSSLNSPLTRKDEIAAMWADLAADKRARGNLVAVAEAEIEKLKARKEATKK